MNSRCLSRGRLAALAASTTAVAACSFALSFDECEVDEHCGDDGMCVAGECRAGDGDGDGPVEITANITEDTVWDAPEYTLGATIFVEPGATLEVRPGTTIYGQQGSALIIERGATLRARGTASQPIVFTSSQAEGTRVSGDWGGVALLGRAPTNDPEPILEGIEDTTRAGFGGSDTSWSCGTLEYVRIEFAGFPLQQDNELNGLTLGGCGSGTIVDYVQVHYGLDDGIEIFGGTVNLQHAVITRAQDDSLDWDLGWTGAAQFLAIQQDGEGDNGIEGSSDKGGATPHTAPNVWNITLIGDGMGGGQRGMTLKEHTRGRINNALIMGHGVESIDITTPDVADNLTNGDLTIDNSLFFDAGADGAHYFPTLDEEMGMEADDDASFDEDMFFRDNMSLTFDEDPGIDRPYDLVSPSWVPTNAVATDAAIKPPSKPFDAFDDQANYVGAFEPNVAPWTAGWTAYPPN